MSLLDRPDRRLGFFTAHAKGSVHVGARSAPVGVVAAALVALATLGPRAAAATVSPSTSGAEAPTLSATVAPDRILILGPARSRLSEAIAAEAEAIGLHPGRAIRADAAALGDAEVADLLRGAVFAVLRVGEDPARVEVWVASLSDAHPPHRLTVEGDGDPERLALRCVELVRALQLRPPAPRAREPSARRPALRLGLTPTLTWSPGGLGPGATLALSGTWMFGERWGAGVFGTVPVLRGAVERPAGRATLAVTVVGAAVRYQPWGRGQRWTPSLDLGVAAALLRSRGEVTSALLQGEDVSAWTAAAQLQLGQAFTLGDLVRLRADATVGLLLAPALLRFAGEEVATWGRPFFSVGVGADLGWTWRM